MVILGLNPFAMWVFPGRNPFFLGKWWKKLEKSSFHAFKNLEFSL